MASKLKELKLKEKILADKYNCLVFSAPQAGPLYLVGGYLRDIMKGRINPDRDYVAGGDYESLLGQIVGATGGKLVKLGGYLSRIVLKDMSTLDFSPLVNDISDDLSRRDFSINSLAWSPESGILDPYGGLEDLRKESIRMICRDNIERDPIRILRAYRFAGELAFRIDRRTRKVIRELSPKIIKEKSERITLEFFKIVSLGDPGKILAMMLRDGTLHPLFPLAHGELGRRLRVLSRVGRIFNALPLRYRNKLCERRPRYLSCLGMLRLEVFMEGIHTETLTLSSAINRKLRLFEKAERILNQGSWSNDQIYEALSLLGDAYLDFLILRDRAEFLSEYDRYCALKKDSLLTTSEIISASGLLRGINLGNAIKTLKKAEFADRIKNREEALNLLKLSCADLT